MEKQAVIKEGITPPEEQEKQSCACRSKPAELEDCPGKRLADRLAAGLKEATAAAKTIAGN